MSALIDQKKFGLGGGGSSFYSQTTLLQERIKFKQSSTKESSDKTDQSNNILDKYEVLIPERLFVNSVSSSTNSTQMSPQNVSVLPNNHSSSTSSQSHKQTFNPKPIDSSISVNGSNDHNSLENIKEFNPDHVIFSPDDVKLEWNRKSDYFHPPGLQNNGQTCYLNTVLQSLTYCPPFANHILSMKHENCTMIYCGLCMMIQHIRKAFSRKNDVINPLTFTNNLKQFCHRFRLNQQQDAQEFLSSLYDYLIKNEIQQYRFDKRLTKYQTLDVYSNRTTAIGQIFGFYHRNSVKCTNCKHESITWQYANEHLLDIEKVQTLEQSFEKHTKVDVLSGKNAYRCDNCKTLSTAHKRQLFYRPPNVLTCVLKRYVSSGYKINNPIIYPSELNLRPYMTVSEGSPVLYKLFSIIVHEGSDAGYGHYVNYTCAPNNVWYKMSDNIVQRVDLRVALKKLAYLLFYVQVKKNVPVPDCSRLFSNQQANSNRQESEKNSSMTSVSLQQHSNGKLQAAQKRSSSDSQSSSSSNKKFEFNPDVNGSFKKEFKNCPQKLSTTLESFKKPDRSSVPSAVSSQASNNSSNSTYQRTLSHVHGKNGIKENTNKDSSKKEINFSFQFKGNTFPKNASEKPTGSGLSSAFKVETMTLSKSMSDQWQVVENSKSESLKKQSPNNNGWTVIAENDKKTEKTNGWVIKDDEKNKQHLSHSNNGRSFSLSSERDPNKNDKKDRDEKEQRKKNKKKKKNKKRKRRSSDSSEEVVWVEKTEAPPQEKAHHSSGLRNLLPKIKCWNGNDSQLTEASKNGCSNKRDHFLDSDDDEYNEEFDRGKSKKIKPNGKDCCRFNKLPYNPFQQAHSRLQQKS